MNKPKLSIPNKPICNLMLLFWFCLLFLFLPLLLAVLIGTGLFGKIPYYDKSLLWALIWLSTIVMALVCCCILRIKQIESSVRRRNPSRKGIQKVFNHLKSRAKDPMSSFHLSKKCKKEFRKNPYATEMLNKVVYEMNMHLGIKQIISVNVVHSLASIDHPNSVGFNAMGRYESNGSQISICRHDGHGSGTLLATLAHECTHHKLYVDGINWLDQSDEETFTDLTAIYFGFGNILKKGYKISSKTSSNYYETFERTRALGYITPEAVKRGLKLLKKSM